MSDTDCDHLERRIDKLESRIRERIELLDEHLRVLNVQSDTGDRGDETPS